MTSAAEDGVTGETIPSVMKTALLTNMAGAIFMLLSLYAASPFGFIITLVCGVTLLLASFALWFFMVFMEARRKGMFR